MYDRRLRCPARAAQDLQNARALLGKRLSGLLHDQYYFNGEKSRENVGDLEWHFGEQEVLSMYLLNDGKSVGADALPLKEPISFEIEPNVTCAWQRANLLEGLSATHLVNATICEVEGIIDTLKEQQPRLTGFRITFETGDFLIFLNQGDNGAVLINKPPPAYAEIETRFVTHIE
ncbi:hypothetical protein [Ectopseudomonas guguanensis]|jgi:hypothetical protein|uniref:Uncharacterized protein n=1 Tax=Ectopseudomonas guguanensis TaxID=1198456 RepID=A0A1H0XDI8_9GAMM|nr:hypothetical protein [Pseudomonas guguanensis]SDQ00994.1 hypothetical protein SAMN05216213_11315 [Pseudomonas guguanensis]